MKFSTLLALVFSAGAFADDSTLLSCQLQNPSAANKGVQAMQVRFSQSQQRVELGGQIWDAHISDTQIQFAVIRDPTYGVLHYNIDRLSGNISIAGERSVVMTGECKLADVGKRVF